jgi:uncharacterized protein
MALCLAAGPRSVDVSFEGSGVTLRATLTLPENASGPLPAVVLLQGSGPTDRDGNQPPAIRTDLLRQLAEAFAEAGVATLRYDKRGQYASKTAGPVAADFVVWDHYVADARAAADFLRTRPEIDPARLGLLGHSEGGLVALAAADEIKPAAIVLLATPGRPAEEVIADQLRRALSSADATSRDALLAEHARVAAAVRDTGRVPADVPPALRAIYPAMAGGFLKGLLSLDPPALAASYDGPVLVMNGERDAQVSPEADAKSLAAALAARPKGRHDLAVVPAASHNFKIARGPGFDGPLVEAARAKLVEWVSETLGRGRRL